MKKSLLIVLLVLTTINAYSQRKVERDFGRLKWLVGDWISTNNKPGETGAESWKIISESRLAGQGITLKDRDTVFSENMELVIKGDDIFFISTLREDTKSTAFKLTSVTNTTFVCENPAHDFPKKITYQLLDRKIKATISGDGKHVDFFFERKP